MNRSELALLRLHCTPGLGRTALFRLKEAFADFPEALNASAAQWRAAGLGDKLHRAIPRAADSAWTSLCERLLKLEIRLLSYWHSDYPPLLREIHDPPALLYLRGKLPDQDCFSIVGSRRASAAGRNLTRELAMQLARHDICIVSGLARGIDSAAHRGALAAGTPTIAVLGCGIDRIYPPENARLHGEIVETGAVLSECPPGAPPLAGHFPARNRIISGLSRGVLIVEAAEKSGSLITGDFALEQGRELFAMPGAASSPTSRGTNRLLKEGAQLVTEASDILSVLWPGQPSRRQREASTEFAEQLSPEAREVFRKLGPEPRHIDEIARECGLTPMELSVILLDLELRGGVHTLPGNFYTRGHL